MDKATPSEAVRQTLATRGWFIANMNHVHTAMESSGNGAVNSIETHLLNTDLRSFSARSLPDQTLLRKSSHLQGPLVLQVVSARDVSRSSIDNALSSSQSRRLLRFKLTDGHTEITAIEYSHIPSMPNDVIPGMKVRLEGKCPVHNGIVCLSPKTVSMLGGTVEALYEEWKINQKYSGSARSASKLSHEGDGNKPPPFERLQTGPPSNRFLTNNSASTSTNTASTSKVNAITQIKGDIADDSKTSAKTTIHNDKPNIPERPREVAEANPVQNQAAAQKLLQKMNIQNQTERRPRGRVPRGKEIEDDHHVLTLAEWEKKKAVTLPYSKGHSSTGQDEDLARQLQEQFDLEDHVETGPQKVAADYIKLSMFNFERDDNNSYEMGSRGRGRGRGRRGGGRGRGRGRG